MLRFSHIFVLTIVTSMLLVVLSKQYLVETEDNDDGRKTLINQSINIIFTTFPQNCLTNLDVILR